MPKLPDVTAFGDRPVPQSRLGKVSYQATHGKEAAPGQGVVMVGRELEQVSNEIERENIRVDTLRAEDAFNQLRARQQELSRGDDGFLNKRGGDAVNNDILKDYGKRFDDATNEIINCLGNDR